MIGTPDHPNLQKPEKLPFNLKNEESPKTSSDFRSENERKGKSRIANDSNFFSIRTKN